MSTAHTIIAAALQIGWNFAPAVIIAAVIGAGRGRWFRFVVGGGGDE